jgi:hypothetical protein
MFEMNIVDHPQVSIDFLKSSKFSLRHSAVWIILFEIVAPYSMRLLTSPICDSRGKKLRLSIRISKYAKPKSRRFPLHVPSYSQCFNFGSYILIIS